MIKKLIILCFVIMIFVGCSDNNVVNINTSQIEKDSETTTETKMFEGYYVYPVDSVAATNYNIEKCRIPQTVLDSMTSEQVAQAVVDYPFLTSWFVSSTVQTDTKMICERSDAYAEIIKRPDGKDVMLSKIIEMEEKDHDIYVIDILKDIMLKEESFINSYTEDEIEYLMTK